jgi:hypothetical protein
MSTTPSSADERALFEAAYINNLGYRLEDFDLHFNLDTGRYDDDDVQCGWWAWQHRASLGAAQVPSLEDIALRAHEHCFKAYEMPKEGVQLYMFDAERLKQVLAALSQPSQQGQGS